MNAVQVRTARWRPADAPRRTLLLLLGATVVLLIAGLLGMHALSGGGASHTAGAEHGMPLPALAHDASAAHGAPADACGDGCAAPAREHAPDAPGHVGIAACVLALLAGLLLLVPPAAGPRASATVTLLWSVPSASAARLFLPPPSLTLLSISRT